MIIGEDYRFRDDIKADTVPIEILTGQFKGVILRYTQVSISEEKDGTAKLRFAYELFDMGNHTETNLRNSKKFVTEAGLILNSMILEVAEDDIAKSGKDDPDEFVEE